MCGRWREKETVGGSAEGGKESGVLIRICIGPEKSGWKEDGQGQRGGGDLAQGQEQEMELQRTQIEMEEEVVLHLILEGERERGVQNQKESSPPYKMGSIPFEVAWGGGGGGGGGGGVPSVLFFFSFRERPAPAGACCGSR
jgi:hypothetical protein